MTWSIIAKDEATGAKGIAVATRAFAVGSIVPYVDSDHGAVATQALANLTYGPRGLRLLREGLPAAEVLRVLLASDGGASHRQVHLMDAAGRFAAHTGADCIGWCGHAIHEGFSVAGNMLAGPEVIAETARVFADGTALPFPRRLIAAMHAGEAAGGDKRGRQSAALLIHTTEDYPLLSLRVDDHADPLAELERLEAVWRQRAKHFNALLATRRDPTGTIDRDVINATIEAAIARDAAG
ncbi:MAG: DUF1028 domain-containing protein [Phreatobacter sp.]|uniref:DUF1028 domain-containing protein n=1 Tax=Phreatobacter sp. TaxID=1966341 RepID=UPI002736C511|nr:DUF1028 domain-containing protein [Phreatobacter sp.]MDP2804166.1 DUF1028 domain-containing protein [Phreatobacter sp.]